MSNDSKNIWIRHYTLKLSENMIYPRKYKYNSDLLCFVAYYILSAFCSRINLHAFLQVASLVPGCDCPCVSEVTLKYHDDVIKWKHFSRFWPFVRGIHRSPVNSPHKGQWRGPLMFSLICVWVTVWVNNREAGDLRRHRDHFDVVVMMSNMAGP